MFEDISYSELCALFLGNWTTCSRSCSRYHSPASWRQLAIFWCYDWGSRRKPISEWVLPFKDIDMRAIMGGPLYRWNFQARALSAGGVSYGTTQSEVPNEDIPPQHRSVPNSCSVDIRPGWRCFIDKLGRICLDILKGKRLGKWGGCRVISYHFPR